MGNDFKNGSKFESYKDIFKLRHIFDIQDQVKERKSLNVVYASDDNFSQMLGISMISLFENNRECEDIAVYILDDGISDGNKQKLNSIGDKYDRTVTYISVENVSVPHEIQSLRWSKSAFTRIFMRRLLPKEISRVLYLDCDVLVRCNLEKFYMTDTRGCCAAGVRDCVSENYLKNLGMGEHDLYCNSGVLLIDLNKWHEEEFMDFLKAHINAVTYPDQDVINGVCSEKMLCVHPCYNCYTALFDFSYKDLMVFRQPKEYYSESEIAQAKKSPAIVHFTSSFLSVRPWVKGCEHPYSSEWTRYKNMSPWSDMPPMNDNRPRKKKIAAAIYKMLPRKIAVNLVGLLHARVLPMLKGRKG